MQGEMDSTLVLPITNTITALLTTLMIRWLVVPGKGEGTPVA